MTALLLGVAGAVAGLGLARYLGTHHHRYDDEQAVPRRSLWWVVPAVALPAAALGALVGSGHIAVATTYTASFVWMAGLAAIDIDVRRLPDWWTLPGYPVVAALLAWCSADEGDWSRLRVALICGVASGAVYLLLALINPAGLGMGDVKLAVPLGALTGWWDPVYAVLAFLAAFVIGLVVGIVAAVRSGEGRKAAFPFGPSMLLGALLVVLLAAPAFS